MFKQLITAVFLLAFALQTFNKALVVFDYFANTTAYAKNCENKARPKMHCHGKCQMMKKLEKEEKKDEQNPDRKSENKNEVVLFANFHFAPKTVVLFIQKTEFPTLSSGILFQQADFLLRPPIC